MTLLGDMVRLKSFSPRWSSVPNDTMAFCNWKSLFATTTLELPASRQIRLFTIAHDRLTMNDTGDSGASTGGPTRPSKFTESKERKVKSLGRRSVHQSPARGRRVFRFIAMAVATRRSFLRSVGTTMSNGARLVLRFGVSASRIWRSGGERATALACLWGGASLPRIGKQY